MKKYENESDCTLVEMTLLGQNDAFEELILRHERAVTGTAMKITRNSFSAEDAAQDAFVAAWMKLDSLKDAFGAFSEKSPRALLVFQRRRIYPLARLGAAARQSDISIITKIEVTVGALDF